MAQHKGEPAASHRAFATVAPQTSRQQHDKALRKAWVLPTAVVYACLDVKANIDAELLKGPSQKYPVDRCTARGVDVTPLFVKHHKQRRRKCKVSRKVNR